MSTLSIALGGIDAASDRFEAAAGRIARTGTDLPGADSDLAADLIDEQVASEELKANVTVARTADQMLGTLIDVVA